MWRSGSAFRLHSAKFRKGPGFKPRRLQKHSLLWSNIFLHPGRCSSVFFQGHHSHTLADKEQ